MRKLSERTRFGFKRAQENSVLRSRARPTADQLQGWWDQVLHHAKKAAEADRTQSPSP